MPDPHRRGKVTNPREEALLCLLAVNATILARPRPGGRTYAGPPKGPPARPRSTWSQPSRHGAGKSDTPHPARIGAARGIAGWQSSGDRTEPMPTPASRAAGRASGAPRVHTTWSDRATGSQCVRVSVCVVRPHGWLHPATPHSAARLAGAMPNWR